MIRRARYLGILLAGWLALAGSAAAHPGVGIVMDRRGNVFYTDLTQVWKISPQGRKSIAVRNVHTHELCLDAGDNLYGEHLWYEGEATDRWGHRVWRLGRDGTLTDVIPPRQGFLRDYSFVRDAAGNMYWADRGPRTVIRKRTPDGTISTLATCPNCRNVSWMTATADGTVRFVDTGDLLEVSPAGALRTVAKNLQERLLTQPQVNEPHLLMGLWTEAARNTYVAVYGARLVKKVTPAGQVQVVARSPFPWSPTGGLVAPNGDLWLLECSYTNAVRVRRIGRDGSVTVF
ncbi:MAG: hypothetical protein ACJ76Y_16100 [Thermoanaerobaculia bacterium]